MGQGLYENIQVTNKNSDGFEKKDYWQFIMVPINRWACNSRLAALPKLFFITMEEAHSTSLPSRGP
jgi:hypothetical protein